jgi:hypothetical protein
MGRRSATTFSGLLLLIFVLGAAPQQFAQTTNVTTGHQDIPAICTGCVYRTGQNLQESMVTRGNITTGTFGQFCNYTSLDGQVYGQPLVVTNVKWGGVGQGRAVVYVATMNGSLYAFDGTPSAPSGAPGACTLLSGTPVSLLLSGETAPTCDNVGGGGCKTIAPSVGILGTPVINTTTLVDGSTGGTIYLVTEALSGSNYYHRLWALDITSLSLTGVTSISITPNGTCPTDMNFSQRHIQRPALLLGGDGFLYIPLSMMDGLKNPYPNGLIFAYDTASLSTPPLCLSMSENSTGKDGGGIWGGGGGPVYAQDPSSSYHIFFNTGNGFFNLNTTGGTDAGDTFVKMSSANTGALSIAANSYTPGDQYYRSSMDPGCSGDVDFGSGSPMLIPDGENSTWQHLAVSGDKEGGLWFMDWTSPGGYTGMCPTAPARSARTTCRHSRLAVHFLAGR